MKEKKKGRWFRRLFLIILGLIILLNFAGVVIEGLFTFNVLQTDVANIRTYTIPGVILSLAFLVVAIILWIKYLKKQKKLLIFWHILSGISVLSILYKFLRPTMLVALLGPLIYFPLFIIIVAAIWYFIWKKLKKEYN
jgi:hypothetical protein